MKKYPDLVDGEFAYDKWYKKVVQVVKVDKDYPYYCHVNYFDWGIIGVITLGRLRKLSNREQLMYKFGHKI